MSAATKRQARGARARPCGRALRGAAALCAALLLAAGCSEDASPSRDADPVERMAEECTGGNGAACFAAANAYAQGQGVARDPAKAFELLRRGCFEGEGALCSRLAEALLETMNTPEGAKAANSLLVMACKLDDAKGCALLAEQLAEAGSADAASEFWQKSCSLGYEDGCSRVQGATGTPEAP